MSCLKTALALVFLEKQLFGIAETISQIVWQQKRLVLESKPFSYIEGLEPEQVKVQFVVSYL